MTAFAARLTQLRRAYPVLRSDRFLHGAELRPGLPEIAWSEPEGGPVTPEGWHDPARRALALQLAGPGAAPGSIDVLRILLNAHGHPVRFAAPPVQGASFRPVLDTGAPEAPLREEEDGIELAAHALAVLAARILPA
jgi:glycogen operon protein